MNQLTLQRIIQSGITVDISQLGRRELDKILPEYLARRILGDVRHERHLPDLLVRCYLYNISQQKVREIA